MPHEPKKCREKERDRDRERRGETETERRESKGATWLCHKPRKMVRSIAPINYSPSKVPVSYREKTNEELGHDDIQKRKGVNVNVR